MTRKVRSQVETCSTHARFHLAMGGMTRQKDSQIQTYIEAPFSCLAISRQLLGGKPSAYRQTLTQPHFSPCNTQSQMTAQRRKVRYRHVSKPSPISPCDDRNEATRAQPGAENGKHSFSSLEMCVFFSRSSSFLPFPQLMRFFRLTPSFCLTQVFCFYRRTPLFLVSRIFCPTHRQAPSGFKELIRTMLGFMRFFVL